MWLLAIVLVAAIANSGTTGKINLDINGPLAVIYMCVVCAYKIIVLVLVNPLTSRPGCMPGSRYTSVGVLFFVI